MSSASGDRVVRSRIVARGGSCSQLDVVVLHDAATTMLHVRAVNYNEAQACTLGVQIRGCAGPPSTTTDVVVRSINGTNSLYNTPAAPERVWPARTVVHAHANGSFSTVLPPFSFSTASITCAIRSGDVRRAQPNDVNTCSKPATRASYRTAV